MNMEKVENTENTEGLTYASALAELENILAQRRSDSCDVDTLAARTARAATLLEFCRKRLTATETELSSILATLEQSAE